MTSAVGTVLLEATYCEREEKGLNSSPLKALGVFMVNFAQHFSTRPVLQSVTTPDAGFNLSCTWRVQIYVTPQRAHALRNST